MLTFRPWQPDKVSKHWYLKKRNDLLSPIQSWAIGFGAYKSLSIESPQPCVWERTERTNRVQLTIPWHNCFGEYRWSNRFSGGCCSFDLFLVRFLISIRCSGVLYNYNTARYAYLDKSIFLPVTGGNMLSSTTTSRIHETLSRRTTKPSRCFYCAGIQDRNLQFMIILATGAGSKSWREVYRRFDTMRNWILFYKSIVERADYPISPTISATTRWEIRPRYRQWRSTCTHHPLRAAGVGIVNATIHRNLWMARQSIIQSMEFSRQHESSSRRREHRFHFYVTFHSPQRRQWPVVLNIFVR